MSRPFSNDIRQVRWPTAPASKYWALFGRTGDSSPLEKVARMIDETLKQQIAYYRARANEYDEWFYREGRYDLGSAENRTWFDEVRIVSEALGRFGVQGDALELACGTGAWTGMLAARADSVTAVDASPEVIRINEAKLRERSFGGNDLAAKVRFVEADLFNWRPDRAYDVIFFGFWLSHVPPERFDAFWQLVKKALKPDGRFFFVDSLPDPTSTARDHDEPDSAKISQQRRLNDGSVYEIIKVYYSPQELQEQLRYRGFTATVERSGRYFLYGYGGSAWVGTA